MKYFTYNKLLKLLESDDDLRLQLLADIERIKKMPVHKKIKTIAVSDVQKKFLSFLYNNYKMEFVTAGDFGRSYYQDQSRGKINTTNSARILWKLERLKFVTNKIYKGPSAFGLSTKGLEYLQAEKLI